MSAARLRPGLWVFAAVACLVAAGLVALGTWQLQRRAWKHDLVARMDARLHAAPVPAPTDCATDCEPYTRVFATGAFAHDRETLVQAVTEAGPGFWVLTPLEGAGRAVLINRGFVPTNRRDPATRAAGQVAGPLRVTGLLRITEPGGAFLRRNDPAAGRWHSRDVGAIAAAQGLERTAPYFVDEDAAGPAAASAEGSASPPAGAPGTGTASAPATTDRAWPAGGLTVVSFHNNHLVYALTWYGLALMVAGAAFLVGRDERRVRRRHAARRPVPNDAAGA